MWKDIRRILWASRLKEEIRTAAGSCNDCLCELLQREGLWPKGPANDDRPKEL